jgi:hypothetical protein
MAIVRTAYRYKHRLVIAGIYGLVAAAPALGADTFDGVYTGTRVLTKGSSQRCEPSEDVSVTINGGALTVTDSALHDYSIGFNPHQDGSFDLITADSRGATALIQGRIVGDALDADVVHGPCEHHWHLTKNPP